MARLKNNYRKRTARTISRDELRRSRKSVKEAVPFKVTVKEAVPFKVIPLGGLSEIGKNCTLIECGGEILIIDCGLAFPEYEMFGIDLVIPDFTYLKENSEKIKGLIITHGHEDHIGGIPYLLRELNVPVYASPLAMGLIDHKLEEYGLWCETHVIKAGDTFNVGSFRVEAIQTNHSIADSMAFSVKFPGGHVIHTGDFKVDFAPLDGKVIDLRRFAQLGDEGVDLLICDSTNVMREGYTPSEAVVRQSIDEIFDNTEKRIIIATFASNVDRVQQIINSAYKYGRKVAIEGRSMVTIISIASELGYLNLPENILIDAEQLRNYPDEKTVIITTGSQGESMAALSRMATGMHRKVIIKPRDTIVFSSSPIPGNEKSISGIINELMLKGAEVIFQDVHVSGHACQEDIKLIYSLVNPKFAIPVHGEYRHLYAQANIASELGYDSDHIKILQTGDVLEIDDESAEVVGRVQTGNVMVDGLGVGDVGNIVLRDRQHLAEDGIIIVVMTLESGSGQVLAGPDIVTRGFVYVRNSESLIDEAKALLDRTMDYCMDNHIQDWGKIKTEVKEVLGDFVWKETKRRPMIMPIIMEV